MRNVRKFICSTTDKDFGCYKVPFARLGGGEISTNNYGMQLPFHEWIANQIQVCPTQCYRTIVILAKATIKAQASRA